MSTRIVVQRIYSEIRNGKIDANNIINIVKAVTKHARGDQEAVTEILSLIARGPDGIQGTADDVPESTLRILKTVLSTGIVPDLVTELSRRRCWSCL